MGAEDKTLHSSLKFIEILMMMTLTKILLLCAGVLKAELRPFVGSYKLSSTTGVCGCEYYLSETSSDAFGQFAGCIAQKVAMHDCTDKIEVFAEASVIFIWDNVLIHSECPIQSYELTLPYAGLEHTTLHSISYTKDKLDGQKWDPPREVRGALGEKLRFNFKDPYTDEDSGLQVAEVEEPQLTAGNDSKQIVLNWNRRPDAPIVTLIYHYQNDQSQQSTSTPTTETPAAAPHKADGEESKIDFTAIWGLAALYAAA